MADKYLGKWATRWTAIQGLTRFFNKMTEEIIDPGALMASGDPFLVQLGVAYQHYEDTLQERNRLDFAHQQKLFYNVLNDPEIAEQVQAQARYVMVDEYQDTNYIQEQLLLRLAHPQNNLCVVGDDDQSLYRFRGATVRRVQVRLMRRKWASFSSKGSLTLATDLLVHPVDLVEYAICHELLHQRLPDHNKGFQAMLAAWMPDWRERERRLMVQGIEWGTTTSIGETYGET